MIQTVLFDLDGTLVDSERVFLRGNVQAAHALGLKRNEADFLPLVGAAGDHEATLIDSLVGAANRADFVTKTVAYVDDQLDHGPSIALPGADELLQTLQAHGRRVGVVTSSSPAHLAQVLHNTGWQDRFDLQVTLAHGAPKPAPDLYQHALAIGHLAPEATVAVEDTPLGVASAVAAGLSCVQVPDLTAASAQATVVLRNLAMVGQWILPR